MRGLETGQSLTLLVIPEVAELIATEMHLTAPPPPGAQGRSKPPAGKCAVAVGCDESVAVTHLFTGKPSPFFVFLRISDHL